LQAFLEFADGFEQAPTDEIGFRVIRVEVERAAEASFGGRPAPLAEKEHDAEGDLGVGRGGV
jgi:hypothetical protein